MLEIIRADGTAEKNKIAAMRARAAEVSADVDRAVADILSNVRENSFAAVKEYSLRFDKAEPREISSEELDAAYAADAWDHPDVAPVRTLSEGVHVLELSDALPRSIFDSRGM